MSIILPVQWSTDPKPVQGERIDDGRIRAAANLAPVVMPGAIGEEVRNLLWTYYSTDQALYVRDLAKAILAARPAKETP